MDTFPGSTGALLRTMDRDSGYQNTVAVEVNWVASEFWLVGSVVSAACGMFVLCTCVDMVFGTGPCGDGIFKNDLVL
jgi:hypothetical protein